MENFSMMDGVIVTIIAMVVVFIVLASLWGLMELVHRFSAESAVDVPPVVAQDLIPDKQRETAAVLTAIIAAYEANPAKKYEIVEVKRIK